MMNNILRDFYRRDHPAYHHVCAVVSECGGFVVIDQFINHSSEIISNVALQLNQYSSNMCARCNQSTFSSITERMQQWKEHENQIYQKMPYCIKKKSYCHIHVARILT